MKRLSLVVTITMLALLVVVPSAQAVPKSPFVGAWIGYDPAPPDGDGSKQHLSISSGKTARLTLVDTYGSICVNNGAPTNRFTSSLTGTVDGDTLAATFRRAQCGPVIFDFLVGGSMELVYDPGTDTLFDGSVTWNRR
jgi:hypothetical protein